MHLSGSHRVIPISLRIFRFITALGIHILSGGNPPMSHRVYALNSFVLPAHEVDVGHAPKLGRCPYGKIQSDSPGSFCQVANL
jgi:hypothetical protein